MMSTGRRRASDTEPSKDGGCAPCSRKAAATEGLLGTHETVSASCWKLERSWGWLLVHCPSGATFGRARRLRALQSGCKQHLVAVAVSNPGCLLSNIEQTLAALESVTGSGRTRTSRRRRPTRAPRPASQGRRPYRPALRPKPPAAPRAELACLPRPAGREIRTKPGLPSGDGGTAAFCRPDPAQADPPPRLRGHPPQEPHRRRRRHGERAMCSLCSNDRSRAGSWQRPTCYGLGRLADRRRVVARHLGVMRGRVGWVSR